jgi:hypothetical protein
MDLSAYRPEDVLFLSGVAAAFALFWVLGRIDRIRPRKRFEKLAQALGGKLTEVDEFEARFEVTISQRTFVLTQKLISRSGSRSSSLYFLTSTPLHSSWQSHFLNVTPLGKIGGWLMGRLLKSKASHPAANGDSFSTRYAVTEQGILPSGWMDEAVRQAIRGFYEGTPVLPLVDDARLEAGEGLLTQRMLVPDKLKADEVQILLQRQTAVADALDSAARRSAQFR